MANKVREKILIKNSDLVAKRILLPDLKLDFMLFAQKEDSKQFDIFFNFMWSMWKQLDKENKVTVFDYLNEKT